MTTANFLHYERIELGTLLKKGCQNESILLKDFPHIRLAAISIISISPYAASSLWPCGVATTASLSFRSKGQCHFEALGITLFVIIIRWRRKSKDVHRWPAWQHGSMASILSSAWPGRPQNVFIARSLRVSGKKT